ncbi:uncharacterized protein LOC143149813 isoform X2 [Ptiloglossa arizonensis]|uniref:uncharacterized protein LOC143149813 isoform X2 n=1 Tax=Ptiloglossa arizonensis TaxID=3350558 RepID=UPI003F9EDFA5
MELEKRIEYREDRGALDQPTNERKRERESGREREREGARTRNREREEKGIRLCCGEIPLNRGRGWKANSKKTKAMLPVGKYIVQFPEVSSTCS